MQTQYKGVPECYYRISVKTIIRDKFSRFALCMKEMSVNGEVQKKWDIPGGGIDHGENPIEALQRELTEETGLTISNINPRPKYFFIGESACTSKPLGLLYFEVEIESLDSLIHSEECSELKFFTLEEALQEDLYPAVRTNLEEAKSQFGSF